MKDVRIEAEDQESGPPKSVKEISIYLAIFSGIFLFSGFCVLAGALTRGNDTIEIVVITIVGILSLLFGLLLLILAWQFRHLRHWTYPVVKFVIRYFLGMEGADVGGFRKKVKSPEVRRAFGLDPLPDEIEDRNTPGR